MSEEGKAIDMMEKMTPEQQAAARKAFGKKQATDLALYKKNLREGNDLKKLQVEELELNVRYYEYKRKWLDLRPAVNALDAEERAIMQEEERKRTEFIKKQEAETAKRMESERPEIKIPEADKVDEKEEK